MPSIQPLLSLRNLLRLDAVVTLASGPLLLLISDPLAQLTLINRAVLMIAALLLVPIGLFIMSIARLSVIPYRGAMTIVTINVIWVVASLALPFAGLISPNATGWALLIAQAAIVTATAALQYSVANHQPDRA